MQPLEAGEPTVVGPYRLLGRLGSGGMGRVYLGRSAGGRTVAVKVVHPHFALDEEFRARFRREVEAARRVGGAWTAPVLDADPEASVPWVATGYAAGPSLAAAVGDVGPLPAHSVRVLGAGLAEALTAVHGLGLVHRDVKPSNVLLTLDGPLLIDFGIARATDGTASLTSTGVSIGSPGYMSPEQITGRGVTGAADVFSLGAVLAYAATGESPFRGDSSAALLYKVVHEEPELGGLDGELRALVTACLAKDPAGRPTPAEVARRLAPRGAAPLVTGGWLPGPLVEQVSRKAVQLLNLEPAQAPPSGPVGFSSPSFGEPSASGAPVSDAPVSSPLAPDASVSRPASPGTPVPDAPVSYPASSEVPVSDAPVAHPLVSSPLAPDVPVARPASPDVPVARPASPDVPAPDAPVPGVPAAGGPAGSAGSAGVHVPPGPGVFGPPPAGVFGPPPGLGAPATAPAHRPPRPGAEPAPRDVQGPPGKLSVSVAATSAPGANGRGRRVSCTVALAVAGALAAVTVGSAFLFGPLGKGGAGKGDAAGAPSPGLTSGSGDPGAGDSAVPAAYLGTWEGDGLALGGTLPAGTFRVTVHRADVGQEMGTFRSTDPLGGVCDDVLFLKRASDRQLVASSVARKSNPSTCTTGRHEIRLTPVGADLKYTSDNPDAGNPTSRLAKIK
ncbi:protein kinase [Streptomyces sp. NPDC007264]|uniref:serine/threonine-protein kinase n=1 Tax=Streptomyces sp. NPDC007264 TaxID=3364777 RepID=UPI0036DAD919